MTIYYTTLIILALALFVAWASVRLGWDAPRVVTWAATHWRPLAIGLAVAATLPLVWELGAWAAGILALAGAGADGARRMQGGGGMGSYLPGRAPPDAVGGSDDVQEQVGGADDAVDDDGLEGSIAEEMESGADELREARE